MLRRVTGLRVVSLIRRKSQKKTVKMGKRSGSKKDLQKMAKRKR
jgi:hypothetical protein